MIGGETADRPAFSKNDDGGPEPTRRRSNYLILARAQIRFAASSGS